jgi:exonuclease III
MKFVSWNVKGFIDPCKKAMVQRIHNLIGDFDVLYLQEVKIVGFMLRVTLNTIWFRVVAFYSNNVEGKGEVPVTYQTST